MGCYIGIAIIIAVIILIPAAVFIYAIGKIKEEDL
jgi:hypothetical protein